jgi:deferrochelatase/peroxidase EfeB
MKTLDSPASTILVTNSEGARYDIDGSFCFVREIETP